MTLLSSSKALGELDGCGGTHYVQANLSAQGLSKGSLLLCSGPTGTHKRLRDQRVDALMSAKGAHRLSSCCANPEQCFSVCRPPEDGCRLSDLHSLDKQGCGATVLMNAVIEVCGLLYALRLNNTYASMTHWGACLNTNTACKGELLALASMGHLIRLILIITPDSASA